jgi:hypothetical protein
MCQFTVLPSSLSHRQCQLLLDVVDLQHAPFAAGSLFLLATL